MPSQVLMGVAIPLPEPALLTPLEFMSRYTLTEQLTMELLLTEHADPTVRATLRLLDKTLLRTRNGVDPTDPRTVFGAEQSVDILIAAGVVLLANRATRIAEILAPV